MLALPSAGLGSTVTARTHFFGAKNVDQHTGAVRRDRVIVSWFGISSLAAAIDGHVVLLDAYINNVNNATPTQPSDRYVDTSYAELGDLRPEALFIGHDHGDHGLGVAALAKEVPGLRIYGTAEHCAQARDDLASNGYDGVRADCHSVLPQGSGVGGAVVSVPAIDGVCTQVVKHLHSAFEPPNGKYEVVAPISGLPSASSLLYHGPGPASAEPTVDAVTGLKTAGDEGGSLLWQFSLGRFTLTWNDTSGPLWADHPEVYDLFRHRLWPTSVEANAILGFDAPLNGWVDPALYVKSVQPKVMVPLHHDLVYSTTPRARSRRSSARRSRRSGSRAPSSRSSTGSPTPRTTCTRWPSTRRARSGGRSAATGARRARARRRRAPTWGCRAGRAARSASASMRRAACSSTASASSSAAAWSARSAATRSPDRSACACAAGARP